MGNAGADTGSLRPLRRPRLPGRATLLRAALVAALLGLAAAVLQTPAGCPPPAGDHSPTTRCRRSPARPPTRRTGCCPAPPGTTTG
ncbi:flagellar biosynthesis protein FlgA, partial [Micromonospora carbonacea]